jgi:EAL domain-containing protein (putative c-di-GMP-specific phosphodiesterase class I)
MIAEGVETEQQAALLRSLDCPFAQGFWFSRPISDTQLIREYGVANTL